MSKRFLSGISCFLVILAILLNVSGGADSRKITGDLTDGISAVSPAVNFSALSEGSALYSNFALRLLEGSHSQENTLLSPLSTACGLFMVANGAGGETLRQFENAVGMSISGMNEYLFSYYAGLKDTGDSLALNNSLWISKENGHSVEKSFLQACASWYDAAVFQTEFNEKGLLSMNSWIRENTDNTGTLPLSGFQNIEGVILLNAAAFDARWEIPFSEDWNDSDRFFREDGGEEFAIFMRSEEELYLENGYCTGFIKNYTTDGYLFAALLPREGTSVAELLSSMDGHSLTDLLSSAAPATVHITMPKFSANLSANLIPGLQKLGIIDAFSAERADFSGISKDNLYIAEIRQNTAITVDEIGTRVVAVSAVAEYPAAEKEVREEKYVSLDRPFVYMILESENLTPLFIGTVMTTE